jgi:phospholipid-transporting ATPase
MYSLETGESIRCLTFSLHEDLGAVKHIFSDKTGTLTRNRLIFRSISMGNENGAQIIENADREVLAEDIRQNILEARAEIGEVEGHPPVEGMTISDLTFLNIALCNDVVVSQKTDGTPGYHGVSSDEVALLGMASEVGFQLTKRINNSLYLKCFDGVERVYTLKQKFEFNADRKRMSVIAEMPGDSKQLVLFTKGADVVMFDLEVDKCEAY